MNKTININIGGYFFHIDENAYKKLKRYLDAIARSLNDDPQGKNEIIADIEARISELLSEKITDERQVINETQIDEVITIMGQPEDYAEAENDYDQNYSHQQKNKQPKKLFRDGEDKFLGGVCSGLGHYIGLDNIWVRLTFLVLTLAGYGFGFVAYIVLWVLLPEAKTTAEKLQMEGEPVNIDNIEKKIRNEFENISLKIKDGADKISNADYEQLRNKTKSGLQDFIETVGRILTALLKVFSKFMGVILLFLAGVIIISLLFAIFSIGSFEILDIGGDYVHYPPFFYNSMLPKWLLVTALILLIGIPFIVLFIISLRILSPSIKKLGTTTGSILLGLWIVSFSIIGFSGIEYATSNAYEGVQISKQTVVYDKNTPLTIAVKNDNDIYYTENIRHRENAKEVEVKEKKVKYSNDVLINVKKSDTEEVYVEIKRESEGRERKRAKKNATKITYNFRVKDNKLIFDAFFLSNFAHMWKEEEIRITVFIPTGTTVFFDNSSKRFLKSIDNTNDIYKSDMANHHFKMTEKGFECVDCQKNNEK